MSGIPESNQPNVNEEDTAESASLRYNLDSLDEYITVSEQVAKEGRLDEAVDMLREASHRYPESPTGRYNLGVALYLRVRQDREHQHLWEDLADDEQLAEEAIIALEGAVETDPTFVEAYNNLGRLYSLRGRKADALQAWNKSLELRPDQPQVREDIEIYTKAIAPSDEELEIKRLEDGDKPEATL